MAAMSKLIERGREVEVLDSALRRAATDGGLVVIEGPAGIGKSRLIDSVRRSAEGFECLSARGGAFERGMAFGLVRQLLEPRLLRASNKERAALLSGPAAPAAEVLGLDETDPRTIVAELRRSLHALFWLVANLAELRPLLLTMDDLQWADEPSLEFLAYLARRIQGLPVLLVAAVREGESWSHRESFEELAAESEVLRPAPLSIDGVGKFIEAVLGAPASADLAGACHAATGGNPFFLGELLKAISPADDNPAAIRVETVKTTVPSTIARSILLRLGRIPEPAPSLAVAAAFLGNDMALRHVAALAGVPIDAAETAADVLVRASIFEHVHPVRFAHPIVRAAIAGDSPPAGAAAAHRRAALLLKAGGESAERIIPHLLLSAPAEDEWVVDTLHRAAQDALARGVPEMASRCLRRALDEPPVSGHVGLLAELSTAELANGDYQESALAARRAIEMAPDPVTRASIRLHEAYALLSVGGARQALATLDIGMVEAGSSDRELTLQLETELVLNSWFTDLAHPVRDQLGRHRNLKGQTPAERHMLTVLALEALRNDEPAETVRDLALRGLSEGRILGDASAGSLAYFCGVCALLAAEAYDEAREAIEAGMRDAIARSSQYSFAGVCWIRGLLEHAEGNLMAGEADERACVEHAVPTMVGIGVASLALVLLEKGDLAGAYSELERNGLLGDFRPLYLWGPYVRGLVRLARGEPAAALADFQDVGRHAVQIGGVPAGLPWRSQVALARLALGDRDAAQKVAKEELGRARSFGANAQLGRALRVSALISGDAQVDLLTEAVKVLEASAAKLERARARYDLGVALLRSGRRREGRRCLEKGHDEARECGAIGLAQACHDELRIAGARPRGVKFVGLESLTASERRVAEMAAGGMTNREIAQALFVTPKTVENQLGRVYLKLEVNSRRALREKLPASGVAVS